MFVSPDNHTQQFTAGLSHDQVHEITSAAEHFRVFEAQRNHSARVLSHVTACAEASNSNSGN